MKDKTEKNIEITVSRAVHGRSRRILKTVILLLAAAIVLLPILSVIAYAHLRPAHWKYITDRNDFTVLDRDGNSAQMAWEEPELLRGQVNDLPQNVAACLSDDGKTLVFSRCEKGKKGNLYTSRRNEDGTWSEPEPIITLNTDFHETDPSISLDGKHLLFSSNRPDGSGGYDIWVSPMTEDGWGLAVNLGPKVNSEFNERGPSMNPGGDKLYFSSDRPKEDMSEGDRRRYWERLIQGRIPIDYDIFVVDNMVLTRHANPLRDRKYRQDIIQHLGGSPETEKAVRRALDWLASTQEADGRWSMEKHGGGKGQDIAGTAMSVLAYYGWGARHDEDGKYKNTVSKGLDWLLEQGRKRNGNFASGVHQGMYGHAMATIALAEAYGITKDPRIKEPLEKARVILVEQGIEVLPRPDGEFLLGRLRRGEYTLEVSAEGYDPTHHQITVPDGNYRIEVK